MWSNNNNTKYREKKIHLKMVQIEREREIPINCKNSVPLLLLSIFFFSTHTHNRICSVFCLLCCCLTVLWMAHSWQTIWKEEISLPTWIGMALSRPSHRFSSRYVFRWLQIHQLLCNQSMRALRTCHFDYSFWAVFLLFSSLPCRSVPKFRYSSVMCGRKIR